MTSGSKTLGNVDRLRKSLKGGSLALQLVDAHQNAAPTERRKAIKAVLDVRLEQVRATVDNSKT